MNKPKLKLAGGIGLLLALSILFFVFLLSTNTVVNGVYNLDIQAVKMKAINSSVGSIRDLNNDVENREIEKFVNRVSLWAIAAGGAVQKKDWDGKSKYYGNGAIVTKSGDKIEYPEDYPEEQKVAAASLTDDYGIAFPDSRESSAEGVPNEDWFVGYYKIGDNVYYLESELRSAMEERSKLSYDAEKSLQGTEESFGIRVLTVSQEENEDGKHKLVYKSSDLPENIKTAEELGITKQMLEAAPTITRFVTGDTLFDKSGTVNLGDDNWQIFVQKASDVTIFHDDGYLVYMIPEGEFFSMTFEQTMVMLAVFVLVGIILLVWFFSTIRLVRKYRLNDEQAEQLGPKKTVRQAFSMITVGCFVLFIVALMFLCLFRLFGTCNSVKKYLKVLEQRIEENEIQKKVSAEELKNTCVSYAERIAGIFKERPDFITKENLQDFSDLMGADYLMIYDNDGKEVISNSRFVDMELGKTPDSSTYEFRRLLKGIPSVVHDAQTDQETGLTNAIVGVSLESSREPGKYGALLIAYPEDKFVPKNIETLDDVMRSLVADGTVSFSLNPENQTIINASVDLMVGRNVKALELPEAALADSYRDFFTLGDVVCYGESKDIDGFLYYYAAEQPHIYKNTLLYAGIATLAGFLFLSALIGYLMFGYRKGFEYWSQEGEALIEGREDLQKKEEDFDQVEDPRERWQLSLSRFGIRTPMHNASVTLEILLVGLIIGIGIWYYLKGADVSGSLIGFVMHGQWSKGMNLFSFTSILILFAQVTIVVSILKLLLRVITAPSGPKGETFRRLGLNLITYGGMIFFIYMALYNLGVNIGALIASLSLPAFALSLGAKDLITDVIAGVSIVFDGEFKVGDVVDIGGFSGEVLEIGVRTTRVLGSGDNIKSIANRDVRNVINKSKRISTFTLKVKVSTLHNDVKEVENMLWEELPKLHDKIPGIVDGPFYWGVPEKGFNFVTMTIAAKFEEENYTTVKNGLKLCVRELFEEKGIPVKF